MIPSSTQSVHHPDACERLMGVIDQRCAGRWRPALHHCVPHLVELTFDTEDVTDRAFEQRVRQVVHEHCCAEEAGDGTDADHADPTLEQQVRILVELLRKERSAMTRGDHQSPPPIMFG